MRGGERAIGLLFQAMTSHHQHSVVDGWVLILCMMCRD